MKTNQFIKAVLFSLFILVSLISCGKDKKSMIDPQMPSYSVAKVDHNWYCFNDRDFVKIAGPQYAPVNSILPWTEAVRISSANNAAAETGGNKAYAVVNRLGILCFENDNITLARDVSLFSDRTAGNLNFVNDTPVFSVFKSAFFNDTILDPSYKMDESQHLFLVQFDETAKISYPIVNCNNIIDLKNSEVTDYYSDGERWLCSVKSVVDGQIIFSYINWYPTLPLLSLSPVMASQNIVVSESDVDTFRAKKAMLDYKDAPLRIRQMLNGFSNKIPFTLDVKSAGGNSSRIYENKLPDSKEQELNSSAIIADSWSGVLFEDGTFFIEGALPGKHILRDGKTVAIRLPKLPNGFIYSNFVISGTKMYVAWEESSFYKTGRSGFLCVDLEETLYKKLI